MDYLHKIRINTAKQLLGTTDKSISEIAAALGYSSSNTFIKTFKKYDGISPGEYRKNLNKYQVRYMIIDFHTHPVLDQNDNLCFYKNVPVTTEIFLSDMDDAGINIFCGSVISGKTSDYNEILKCNEKTRQLKKIYGERYIPGIHVSPLDVEGSINEINKSANDGICLIGELVPYYHGWEDYSCNEFSMILDAAEKHSMVVSLHTMDIRQMEKMALQHKNIPFVFAHPGEPSQVNEHIDVMKKCDNVYLDISGSGLHRYGILKYLSEKVGAERILFGTDYPICNLQMYVNAVLGEKLTDKEKECILYENAANLLRL